MKPLSRLVKDNNLLKLELISKEFFYFLNMLILLGFFIEILAPGLFRLYINSFLLFFLYLLSLSLYFLCISQKK